MGISVIPSLLDGETKPMAKTVGDIVDTGKYYRHPDSALISYPLVVAESTKIGSLPKGDRKIKIAVVGGGVAGVASCYELSRLGNSDRIQLTLYESDPKHFTFIEHAYFGAKTFGKKAGRIFAARTEEDENKNNAEKSSENNRPCPKEHTVYEIGAMRFPEIAGMTWHYARVAFGNDAKIKVFPNPGKVPIQNLCSVTVQTGMFGDPELPTSGHFLIGGKYPYVVAAELASGKTPTERLEQINKDWKDFAKKYDPLSLENAVRQIIRAEVERGSLANIGGLCRVEDKVNYYSELFGCFGFGTGGLKSIHNMSLTEMMRLLLWDYVNEYTLPVEENVEFVRRLFQRTNEKLKVHVKHARVCDVCHDASTGKALIFSYKIRPETDENSSPDCAKSNELSSSDVDDSDYVILPLTLPEPDENSSPDCAKPNKVSSPHVDDFDYVILAVTPQQMHSMISRAGFSNIARNVRFGDYNQQCKKDVLARPPLVLSTEHDEPNSEIFTAIKQVHMTSSSKIYVTLKEEDFNKHAPNFQDQGKIKSIVSDCGLGSSYIVPSPILENICEETGEKYLSLLLSYAWEEDTKRLQHNFYEYPINKTDSEANKKMMEAVINRTMRDVRDAEDLEGVTYNPWWFGKLLSDPDCKWSDPLSHDWTTDYSAGAFKLDTPGCHYNSNLCFRYHTHAVDPKLKNRFFIAGDSYSHLGGWIEGAFMSAINAITGLVVAANDGNIEALEPEARKVITTLDKVVSV